MERLGGPRLNRAGLIAALALLPLTPLVTSVVYRLTFGTGMPSSTGNGGDLNPYIVIWTAMLVGFAVALVPPGLILMRRPDADATWALGMMTIAVGLIGVAYAAAWLVVHSPDISPRWIRMLPALSIVPTAAGILLMRKRGISAVEAMGILAIALGVVGAIDYFPQIPSPLTGEAPLWLFVGRFSQAIALGIVPAAVGIRLLRKREISAVQALGNLAMALGVIGAVYYFPSTFFLLAPDAQMLEVSLAQLVSFLTKAISLSIAPLIVGAVLMRNNDISTVKMLGILVIMSGVVWSIHKSGWSIATLMRLDEWESLMKTDESYALFVVRAVVEFATVAALAAGSTVAGILMVRRDDLSVVSASGLIAIVAGIIGAVYVVSILASILLLDLLNLWVMYEYSIDSLIFTLVPLIVAVSVVPVSAGIIQMRKTHASGIWALGHTAVVCGVVGTTYSAVQLFALGPPPYRDIVGIVLPWTAWLP